MPVRYAPGTAAGGADDSARLVVESDALTPRVEVPVRGRALSTDCPTARITCENGRSWEPGCGRVSAPYRLSLSGTDSVSPAGTIARWEWTVAQPASNGGALSPGPTDPRVRFDAVVAGRYDFCLEVWDDAGQRSCTPSCVELDIPGDETIYVELTWQTPAFFAPRLRTHG